MKSYWLFLLVMPMVGALIGWLTNHIALWMLFHPYRPVGIGRFKWQGVIPRRREQLAESLSAALEDHLLTLEDQQAILDSVDIEQHLDRIVTQVLEKQLPRSVFQKVPAINGIREKLIDVLRGNILRRLPARLSDMDSTILVRVAAEMDLAGHVRNKMLNLPVDDLERLIRRVARRELLSIELSGAGIGALIGLIQALLAILIAGYG